RHSGQASLTGRGFFLISRPALINLARTIGEEYGVTRERSLIRYESVLGVSARSRGERSRPACGRSVSGGQPNDDENCVVLLLAGRHRTERRPPSHTGKAVQRA